MQHLLDAGPHIFCETVQDLRVHSHRSIGRLDDHDRIDRYFDLHPRRNELESDGPRRQMWKPNCSICIGWHYGFGCGSDDLGPADSNGD